MPRPKRRYVKATDKEKKRMSAEKSLNRLKDHIESATAKSVKTSSKTIFQMTVIHQLQKINESIHSLASYIGASRSYS